MTDRTVPDYFSALANLDNDPPFLMPIRPLEAFEILAQLQLALRHPANTGPAAERARDFALRLQHLACPPGSPLAELAEKGWGPGFDMPAAGERRR